MSAEGITAEDVAAALIEARPGCDQMQLHKLLYLVQAAALAWFHEPAFRERIEAWQYGPMVRGIAGLYKDFGHGPIAAPVSGNPAKLDERLRWTVRYVVDNYGRLSGPALARLVKSERAPWRQARGNLPDDASSTAEISVRMIEDFHGRFGLAPAPLASREYEFAQQFLDGDVPALADFFEAATGSRPTTVE
jgi:uncharacterized phage-associated protein